MQSGKDNHILASPSIPCSFRSCDARDTMEPVRGSTTTAPDIDNDISLSLVGSIICSFHSFHCSFPIIASANASCIPFFINSISSNVSAISSCLNCVVFFSKKRVGQVLLFHSSRSSLFFAGLPGSVWWMKLGLCSDNPYFASIASKDGDVAFSVVAALLRKSLTCFTEPTRTSRDHGVVFWLHSSFCFLFFELGPLTCVSVIISLLSTSPKLQEVLSSLEQVDDNCCC
mmetsp:Transcript_1473/g.2495  ORF Transcript_1473/g.2495 Transcript_1473/m.2495 type:complete len:229 (+) Transcript_1473:415-1101(+)